MSSKEEYAVEAHLRVLTGNADTALARVGGRLAGLGRLISGAGSSAGGLVTQLAAVGASYVGINALSASFQQLTHFAVDYNSRLEGMQISLAAVIGAADGIDFSRAQSESHALFEQLRTDAMSSVATTEQLFEVAQTIYGPVHGAGLAMSEVRTLTSDAVTAATALGVPLDMAAREMNQMVSGAAGMHNVFYRMLHATGAIAEDSHEWNQMTAPERVRRLQGALGQFTQAADAYGHSFAGVMSTFQDLVENFTSTFFGPAFAGVRRFLDDVNQRLLANRSAIESALTDAGQWLERAFGDATDRLMLAVEYLQTNWSRIMNAGHRFLGLVQRMLPSIEHAAELWLSMSVARGVVGGAIGAVGLGAQVAGGLGIQAPTLLAALGGGGGAAAAGGGGAAALSAELAPLTAAFEALTPLLAPLAAVLAVIGSVVEVVVNHWQAFLGLFEDFAPLLDMLGDDFAQIGSDLWDLLQPLMEIVGGLIIGVAVPAFLLLVGALHVVLRVVHFFTDLLARMGRIIQAQVGPALDDLIAWLSSVAEAYSELFGSNPSTPASGPLQVEITNMEELASYIGSGVRDAFDPSGGANLAGTETPDAWQRVGQWSGQRTPPAHNDFRGARITVNQEFREADPDRVLMQMMADIHSQAESRLGSGFAPILSR